MAMTRRDWIGIAAGAVAQPGIAQNQPPRLARRDSYFGMHFDLHPGPGDKALGRDVSDEMVERFLTQVKPDFVQYDCKGHVGWLGYPSQVSASAPHIVKDSLEIWRRVTARRGVALYIHFSGVWDSRAVEEHPEWARVRPDGAKEPNQTSIFGPYVDQRMLPQLKEAVSKYDLDGAWVDGECWATSPDYCEAAVDAFRKATGLTGAPKSAKDPGWHEFLEINREQFRKYVRHYVDELHRTYPKLQVASNWLYSTMVPERPDLPVDYLSGDYLGNAPLSDARIEARYLGATGKPWDLMAWGFRSVREGQVHKPAVQLMQEASVVLAQGGGFQIYYTPTRTGWIDDRHIGVMSRVATFCRARQAVSHKTATVPQVAVLFSKYSLYHSEPRLFGGWGAALHCVRGTVDALVESHYSVDILPDWKLAEAGAAYPVIVAPDWSDIGPETANALVEYVRAGGRLLVLGAENARRLGAVAAGVVFDGEIQDGTAYLPGSENFGFVKGRWQDVRPQQASIIETRYRTWDATREGKPAASLATLGKGKIAVIYGPLGTNFALSHDAALREVMSRVVSRLEFEPAVRVEGPPTLEVTLRRSGGQLLVHLANTTGTQIAAEHSSIDFIPAVGPVKVAVKVGKQRVRVALEPGNEPVRGEVRDGVWSGTIPRIEIHSVLRVEEG